MQSLHLAQASSRAVSLEAASPPVPAPHRSSSATLSSDQYDESWFAEHLGRQPRLRSPVATHSQVPPLSHHAVALIHMPPVGKTCPTRYVKPERGARSCMKPAEK